MTITIPRSTLLVAGSNCLLAGLSLGNAAAAWDAGRSPLVNVVVAVMAVGLAVHQVREAARPQSVGPIPKTVRRQ